MTGEAKRRALRRFMTDPTIKTRRFDMGPCLNCQAPLTGITGHGEDPRPGECVMVCAYCSHVMEWTGEKFVELSDEAIRDIAGDDEVLAIVEATAHFQQARRPAKCAACGAENPYGKIVCQTCNKPLVFPND